MKQIKQNIFFKKIHTFLKQTNYIFFAALPLIIMDVITKIIAHKIDFFNVYGIPPTFFSLSWIILFLSLSLLLKKKIGKYIYLITNISFLIIFITNNIYYSVTNNFFDFILLESFSEGSSYIVDAIKNVNPLFYLLIIFIIYLIYKGYKKIPYTTNNKYKPLLFVIIYFIILHTMAIFSLGKAFNTLEWSAWQNPKNNYITFYDNNKSMKITGLYEYTLRNFYITFLKPKEVETEEDKTFLDNAYIDIEKKDNKYTGLFEDKNLIFIQLEGVDNWLLTKETTPTLYKMLENSINFTDHYSFYSGGGSTFNSEFAINTGFITPLSYTQNAYTFNKNEFPNTLAKIFKNKGYAVNAFHMNTGEFYSRTTNYQNWGYDNYYGLKDMFEYKDNSYMLDRELIENETFNNLIFRKDQKFVNYLITYSLHTPFTNKEEVCEMLYNLDNLDKNKPFKEMTELECIKRQVKETDYMVELLLENLKEKDLIDDTVIVVFTDHYLYTMNQKILYTHKNASNNLINKTPFFIWSNNIEAQTFTKTTSQLNILPTILNLFNIDYNPNHYIGKDVLAPEYEGIVFFSDYSWYDGNVYVENGIVTNHKNISPDELEEKNSYINYITRKNDLTLKFNYFKQIKEETNS